MAGIDIVKPAVDIGLATNQLEAHQAFWRDTVGLAYDHLLKVGGGVHQHRYDLHGAVLKLNSHRDPLETTPTGFIALVVVAGHDLDTDRETETPDGTPVRLVADPRDGVRTVVTMEATDADRTARLIADGLGAERTGTRCRVGETVIDVVAAPDRAPTEARDGLGIRYLTIQVRDVESAHGHALANGLTEGFGPIRLGDTAYISFVRLPDGDWVELSQRASLTGPLPDVTRRT